MALTKIRGLQLWCAKQVNGYRDVAVKDMTTSWKSGLAFCAIIHRYRPDLIDYDSLSKENVFENNDLAFTVAEQELGIPAFLEAADMVAIRVPDKLSVITYVSQYYNYFHDKPQLGGPGVQGKVSKAGVGGVKRHQDSDPNSAPESKRTTIREKTSNRGASPERKAADKTSTLGDKCEMCDGKVYLLERHIENGKLYHRSCFRHSEMSPTSKVFQKSPFLSASLSRGADAAPRTSTPKGRAAEPVSVATSKKLFEKDDKPGFKSSQAASSAETAAPLARKTDDARTTRTEGFLASKKSEEKASSDVLPNYKRNRVQDTSTEKNQKTVKSWLSDKSVPREDQKTDDKKIKLSSGLSTTDRQISPEPEKTTTDNSDKLQGKNESSEGFLSGLMKNFSPAKDEKPKKSGLLEFLSSKNPEEEKKTEGKKESSSVSALITKPDRLKSTQPASSDSSGRLGKAEKDMAVPAASKQTEASAPVPKPRQTKSGEFSTQATEQPKFAVPAVPRATPRSSMAVEGKLGKKTSQPPPQVLPIVSPASRENTPMEVDDDNVLTSPESPPPLPASAPPPLTKLPTPRDSSPPGLPATSPPSSSRSGRSSPTPLSARSVLSASSQGRGRSDSASSSSSILSLSPPNSSRSDSKPVSSTRSSSPKPNRGGHGLPTKSNVSTSAHKSSHSESKAKDSGHATSVASKSKEAQPKSSASSVSNQITRPFKLELRPAQEPPKVSYTVSSRQESPMEVGEALTRALSPDPSSPPVAVLVTPQGEGEDKRVLGSLLQSLANIRQTSPRSKSTSSAVDDREAAPSQASDVALRKTEEMDKKGKFSVRPKSVPSILTENISVFSGSGGGADKTESNVVKTRLGAKMNDKAKSHDDLGMVVDKDTDDVPAWKKALEDRKAKREKQRMEEKMETESVSAGRTRYIKKGDRNKKLDTKPAECVGGGDGPSWIQNAENLTSRLRHMGSPTKDKDKLKSKSAPDICVEKTTSKETHMDRKKQRIEKMEVDPDVGVSKFRLKPEKSSDVKPHENGIKSDVTTPLWKKGVTDKHDEVTKGVIDSGKLKQQVGKSKDVEVKNVLTKPSNAGHADSIPETPRWKQGLVEKSISHQKSQPQEDVNDVPEWQKALEERKARLHSKPGDALKPKPMIITERQFSLEEKNGAVTRTKPSETSRPKSELPPSKGSSDSETGKLAWQLEAERRMAALKSGFVDPEKAKIDKTAEKKSRDFSQTSETVHPPTAEVKKDDRHATSSSDHGKSSHVHGPSRPPPPEVNKHITTSGDHHTKSNLHGGPARPPPPDVKKVHKQLPSLDVYSGKTSEKPKHSENPKHVTSSTELDTHARPKTVTNPPRPKLDIFKAKDPVAPSTRGDPCKVQPQTKAKFSEESKEKKSHTDVKSPRDNKPKETASSSIPPLIKPRTDLTAGKQVKSKTTWYTPETSESTTSATTEAEETPRRPKVIPAPQESPPPTPPPRLRKIGLKMSFDFDANSDLESSMGSVERRDGTLPPEKPPRTLEYQGLLTPTSLDFSSPKAISPIKIQQTLTDIDHRLTELELRGRQLEDSIRNVESNEMEDDSLMVEWFKLVNEKNVLVRQEADLVYLSREQELLDEQEQVELQLRYLLSVPENQLTKEMKEEEEFLLRKKLAVINQRSCIVDSIDEDRLRYEQEDKEIDEILSQKGFAHSPNKKESKESKTKEEKKKRK